MGSFCYPELAVQTFPRIVVPTRVVLLLSGPSRVQLVPGMKCESRSIYVTVLHASVNLSTLAPSQEELFQNTTPTQSYSLQKEASLEVQAMLETIKWHESLI